MVFHEDTDIKIIKGATLITGSGQAPIENASLVIEGARIKAIEKPGARLANQAEVIEAGGQFVLPGLIDAHVHLFGMMTDDWLTEGLIIPERLSLLRAGQQVKACLEAGFTTIRDCGSSHALHIKSAIAEGTLVGPRIIAAGYILNQTFGHAEEHFLPIEWVDYRRTKRGHTLICDGVDQCRQAARYALREGGDFIKICTSGGILSEKDTPEHVQFNRTEIEAIVEAASNASTFVASHAQNDLAIKNAVEAGVRTIEHGFGISTETLEAAKDRNVVFVPTLSLDRAIIDGGVAAGYPQWAVEKQVRAWDQEISDTVRLYQAGVIMAVGTDFLGSPLSLMGQNARELELLVEYCALDPMTVIVAATRNGAKACGLETELGTIEEGKLADLIVVSKDPLADIRVLKDLLNIKLVIKGGRIWVDRR